VSAEGGAAVRLTSEDRYDPKESLDGKRVFYVLRNHQGANLTEQIWSVAADGGDERYETAMTTNASWAPGNGGIYFLDDAVSGSPGHLRFFDFASRHFQELTELDRDAGFPGDA
jgi:hypothetical protein